MCAYSQHKGSLTGRVLDRNVQTPLAYSVIKIDGNMTLTVEADSLGFFVIKNIPVGNYQFQVSLDGYKTAQYSILIEESVISKQLVYLEEDITVLSDVVLYSEQGNPYKVTSSYQFEAKDFGKSATSFGDPSRLVQVLPAVAAANDGNNQVAVRGNSPFNNNWYLEGIEIPNPNHFGGYGSSGGFISVFNENTLEKVDFYLGAYPAMYGNSNSSVFDMKLRSGNIRKREHNVRLSPLGVYAGAEGCFKKGKRGSYMLNARIFNLHFFKQWGLVPKENVSIPAFKDFSYKIVLPSKSDKLEISLFGFGGANKLELLYASNTETRINKVICSNISLDYKVSSKLRFNTTLQYSHVRADVSRKQHIWDTLETEENTIRNNTYIHIKKNSRLNLRLGIMVVQKYLRNNDIVDLIQYSATGSKFKYRNEYANALTTEPYISVSYRYTDLTRFTFGLHTSNISFNRKVNVEPRVGMSSRLHKRYEIAFSAGMYSKFTSFYAYKNSGYHLPSTRSLHLVNAHTLMIDSSLSIKSEMFFQYLWNAYLFSDSSRQNATFLNKTDYDMYYFNDVGTMTVGSNYGIDINVSKKFKHGLDLAFAGALYRSLYKDGTAKWRNTSFDNRFTTSLQASKEMLVKKSYGLKSMVFSIKVLYFGGFYTIPLDYQRSVQDGIERFNSNFLYTQKLPNYFRVDLGAQVSYSRSRIKHELRLDVQNASNKKNVLRQYYDTKSKMIKNLYQLPIIPVISYTAYF